MHMLPQHSAPHWPSDRLTEARAVVADVVHHSDHLIRLACNVLVAHGETKAEREDARVLLMIIDARRSIRSAQRQDDVGRTSE
jgi:hypothetical protein